MCEVSTLSVNGYKEITAFVAGEYTVLEWPEKGEYVDVEWEEQEKDKCSKAVGL